uniref:Uncharacterized protein n=1 Tax=Bos mutus grunniens TaxID=30521 RepID=A0A8B9YPD6_BOSMU
MTKFGGGVNTFEVDLLQGPPFGLYQQGLVQSEHSLLGSHHAAFEHDKVIGHLTVVDKATQRVDALVRQIVISRGIVLDQFAVLDEVALTNLVDLLVDLSVVMVAFLPSPSHREGHPGRMPRPNTGNLAQPSVGLTGQLLGVPMAGDAFVALALGHPNDINHLILAKHLAHRDLLLEPLAGPVQFLGHSASVHLDLHEVCLLLAQRKQAHLGVGNDMDDLTVLFHAAEVPLKGLLAVCVLPLLAVFGEGLLLGLMPVLVEAPFALVADMLSKDGLKGPEASGCFHVAHDAHNHHGWSLHDGHSLHNFLLVHLGPWPIDLPHNVGHASLVAKKGSEVYGLGRVILGEALHLPAVLAAALPRQEAQGPVPGSRELPVRHPAVESCR